MSSGGRADDVLRVAVVAPVDEDAVVGRARKVTTTRLIGQRVSIGRQEEEAIGARLPQPALAVASGCRCGAAGPRSFQGEQTAGSLQPLLLRTLDTGQEFISDFEEEILIIFRKVHIVHLENDFDHVAAGDVAEGQEGGVADAVASQHHVTAVPWALLEEQESGCSLRILRLAEASVRIGVDLTAAPPSPETQTADFDADADVLVALETVDAPTTIIRPIKSDAANEIIKKTLRLNEQDGHSTLAIGSDWTASSLIDSRSLQHPFE